MDNAVLLEIKGKIESGTDPGIVKAEYLSKGFLEGEIEKAISAVRKSKHASEPDKFAAKELFDVCGHGFSSAQFLNIFMHQSGVGIFFIGIANAARSFLSVLSSTIAASYDGDSQSLKRKVIMHGAIFAALLMLMAAAFHVKSAAIVAFLFIISGITIALHGDYYLALKGTFGTVMESSGFMQFVRKYSLIITATSLIAAGLILDASPRTQILGIDIFGPHLVFGISALSFCLGLIVFSTLVPGSKINRQGEKFSIRSLVIAARKAMLGFETLLKDPVTRVLILSSMLVASAQVLQNAYFGIYIYDNLGNYGFGKYLNVAIIFMIAALTSLLGPKISRMNAKEFGKLPMLVFGTILMSIMPLTYFYNPNIVSISMGTIIGIIGAAITGIAHGLLTNDILTDVQRKEYFASAGIVSVLPYLVTAPIGSFVASSYGLRTFFLVSGLMIISSAFLYFLLVWQHHKKSVVL